MAPVCWLIAFVVLVGVEIGAMALTTIWFAGGALLAFTLSLFDAGVEAQLAIFVIVSLILLFFTRPLVFKYLNGRTVKTNVDSLMGRNARIMAEVNSLKGTGVAVVNEQRWTARALQDGDIFPRDTQVIIREIHEVRLIASSLESENGAAVKNVLDKNKEH